MPHIQGVHRDAVILFPPTLDEYITADNPVRCIDAFVDELDLHALGFQRALANRMGRPAYAPTDLLKLYLYGYLNRIRSSRMLERETQRNVEVMWLLKKLTPDFKTIADFRKDNLEPLKQVCRCFTLLCKQLDLFGGILIAIDGCKFKAVNNYERNFTAERLAHLLQEVDTRIETYLAELNQADTQTPPVPQLAPYLMEKVARLRARKERYQALSDHLQHSEDTQVSLTDADSRSMVDRHKTMVGYNVQFATDAKHKLIVDHEVTNAVTDQHQLAPIAQRARAILGVETLDALADRGYYDGEQIKSCVEAGITPWVSKPHTSRNQKHGLFTKADFIYDAEHDTYRCRAGATLTYRFSTVEDGRPQRYYATPACSSCPLRERCTRNQSKGRRITRWEHEGILDTMTERIRTNRAVMRQRKEIVEHPFGTMKRGMQQSDFLMRGLRKVSAEMSLTVLAYNLKRVIRILGVSKLLQAIRDGRLKQAIRAAPEVISQLHIIRAVLNVQLRTRLLRPRGRILFLSGLSPRLFTQSLRVLGRFRLRRKDARQVIYHTLSCGVTHVVRPV